MPKVHEKDAATANGASGRLGLGLGGVRQLQASIAWAQPVVVQLE